MLIEAGPFTGLQRKHYGLLAVDPPWHFRARTALQMSNWTSRRDAEKHYAVMGVDDIAALPVKELAADDAHLMLWITGPLFVEGKHLAIMKAWGFRPSAVAFTWVKLRKTIDARQFSVVRLMESDLHVGLGLTTRKNAEFVVLGRRGNAKRVSKKVREIILAPVREHSRKPDEFYRRAVEYAAGPYLELFGRQQRPGWTTWGNQTDRFAPALPTTQPPTRAAA
jgi:N6-adenosine-specific RNA methylase IME4